MADEPFADFLGSGTGESPSTDQTATTSGSYTVKEPSPKEKLHKMTMLTSEVGDQLLHQQGDLVLLPPQELRA